MLPDKLKEKLIERHKSNNYRRLDINQPTIDFASNDYLGFCTSTSIQKNTLNLLEQHAIKQNGASGSRLLTGNFTLYDEAEQYISKFHSAASSLIFTSGYTANVGFFSCVPQKGDIVFYDESIHASIRDGIRLGFAKSYKYRHNDLDHLKKLILKHKTGLTVGYIVTESVFSMEGDFSDLKSLATLSKIHGCNLVVDEAHATGVIGRGRGLVQELGLEEAIFARVIPFGKALGSQGACILGSKELIIYLINFARSFIYTTALPPYNIALIIAGYMELKKNMDVRQVNFNSEIKKLHYTISYFKVQIDRLGIKNYFITSNSAIQYCKLPYFSALKLELLELPLKRYGLKIICSPTVPKGKEGIRICLHSFNTNAQIDQLLIDLQFYLNEVPNF